MLESNSLVKILIIEDDDFLRNTLVTIIRKNGYAVDGAGTGELAVEKARASDFDIILSDVRLPNGIDGRDVLLRIRELGGERNIKMILMTGFFDEYDPNRSQQLGMMGALKKPFKTGELFDYIARGVEELKNGI